MPFVVLIGASGAGKTTLAQAIAQRYADAVKVVCLAPEAAALAATINQYGCAEREQHSATLQALQRLAPLIQANRPVLLEAHTRFEFLADAIRQIGTPTYWPFLLDCADAIRTARLVRDPQQVQLADSDLLDWAAYLRGEARGMRCEILDTGALSLEQCIVAIAGRLFGDRTKRG